MQIKFSSGIGSTITWLPSLPTFAVLRLANVACDLAAPVGVPGVNGLAIWREIRNEPGILCGPLAEP
jgi:hypothetical protein